MSESNVYSIGELAKLSGTTIRTIQYYDKINLLHAKRDKGRNLRYYTPSDLLTLQQILFYKKLGFTLKEIKSHLVDAKNVPEIKHILQNQSDILFRKEMELKTNIAIIEAILATLDHADVNWEQMIKMVLGLNKQTVLGYVNVEFDQEASDTFEEKFADYTEVLDFYWQWKQLTLEAVFYTLHQTPIKSKTGYIFGEKWDNFIKSATNEDPELIVAYSKGLEQSHEWPEEDLFLYQFCNDFIDGAYSYYCEERGDNR